MDADFLLIYRMKQGETAAVEVFVRKYYADILKYCRYHLTDFGQAEDMAQETFERFFRNIQEYSHYGKAKNYLYTIAGNLCKNYQKQDRELPTEDTWLAEAVSGADISNGSPGLSVENLDLYSAMAQLLPELRNVLILYYFQGLKQKEIADILGIGLPLVKYRLSRAKELLRDMMKEGYDGQA